MGFAMAFSADVRSYGIPTAAVTFVVSNVWQCFAMCRNTDTHMDLGIFCFLPYLLPITVLIWPKEYNRKTGLELVLALRFIEDIIFGILAAAFGQTACGSSLEHELLVLQLGCVLFCID